jgi:hypothetical protein
MHVQPIEAELRGTNDRPKVTRHSIKYDTNIRALTSVVCSVNSSQDYNSINLIHERTVNTNVKYILSYCHRVCVCARFLYFIRSPQ